MNYRRQLPGWLGRVGLVTLAFVAVSCGDDDNVVNPPTTGSIEVTAATSGDEIDADGYTVSVGAAGQAIGVDGSVTFSNQTAGDHTVELSGVAANCTVAGDNPRTVSVTAGNTTSTTFDVTCSATTGELAVTTVSAGDDIDADGYTVSVDGAAGQAIDVNGTLTVTGLAAGDHTVELGDFAANCTVAGDNPRTVAVTAGATAPTQFDVTCTALSGDLKVVNVTSGNNPDDAFTVNVDGGAAQALAANDSLTVTGLTAGDHTVELGDVAANCAVAGDNPRTVTVASGGEVRTQFDVTCQSGGLDVTSNTWGIGLDADGYSVLMDGGSPQAIGVNETLNLQLAPGDYSVELTDLASNCTVQNGSNPRIESVADGAVTTTTFDVFCFQPLTNQVVFESSRDGNSEIYVKTAGGAFAVRLTNNAVTDRQPDVSPDGNAVVFESNRAGSFDIWKMNSLGFQQLTTSAADERDPSWAGDRSFIAYQRRLGGSQYQIWKMATGGAGQVAVSSAPGGASDDQPAASPDAAWILFMSNRDGDTEIYVVNVATGVETRLTNDLGADGKPAWWFDGSKILWASDRTGDWEIYVADFDAVTPAISNIVNLTQDPGGDKMPNMRRDGSSIAFVSDRGGTNDIWTMNPDGSNQAKFASSGNDPSWSP